MPPAFQPLHQWPDVSAFEPSESPGDDIHGGMYSEARSGCPTGRVCRGDKVDPRKRKEQAAAILQIGLFPFED